MDNKMGEKPMGDHMGAGEDGMKKEKGGKHGKKKGKKKGSEENKM
jgi:hypothetical protein